MTTSERMLREAEFRKRRRRVLRAEGGVVAALLLGLGAIFAAKTAAPAAFEGTVAFFVLGTGASLLVVQQTARRHWRCPACDVRWETSDTLASFNWNHCPACGVPLLAHSKQRDQERIALTEFAFEALSHDELVARFERRRRRGLLSAGAVVIVGVAILAWVQTRGFGEAVEHAVVALFTGLVVAAVVLGARCPRCRIGVIAARGRHCQRCGLLLRPDLSDGMDRRTGT